MQQVIVSSDLIVTLAGCYEEDPHRYVTLPKKTVDSATERLMVAELRNEGIVEEQVRGVIRMTARGYSVYQNSRLHTA